MTDGPLTGKMMGEFMLGRQIGDGGMGTVYLASHADYDELLAIKVLLPDYAADDEFRQRFQREGQMLATLRHPHIIPVYHVGEDEGYLFFVMRFVRGLSLFDLMQKRRFSPLSTWQILKPVAQALDHAHEQSIIHRDIKPGNILIEVTPGDSGPRNLIYLADFGLSKVLNQTPLTKTGISVGTPQYMSPEQVRDEELGPASDVYALSLVIYEMLLGRWPFYHRRPEQIAMKHISDKPPAPSRLHMRFPAALEAVILRGLEKEPHNRYPSAGAFSMAYADAVRGLDPEVRTQEFWVGPPGL